jgi:hypothetical protein
LKDILDTAGNQNEEAGYSQNMSLESVIEWNRIVQLWYQMNGKTPTSTD